MQRKSQARDQPRRGSSAVRRSLAPVDFQLFPDAAPPFFRRAVDRVLSNDGRFVEIATAPASSAVARRRAVILAAEQAPAAVALARKDANEFIGALHAAIRQLVGRPTSGPMGFPDNIVQSQQLNGRTDELA